MKKILFLLLTFIVCINVVDAYSIDERERYQYQTVRLLPGEYMFKDGRFDNIACSNRGPLEMYSVNGGCIMINTGRGYYSIEGNEEYHGTNILHREYDPETGELIYEVRERLYVRYILEVEDSLEPHVEGKTSLTELALVMNDRSETGSMVYSELRRSLGYDVAFSTAVDGNSLLVVLGQKYNPSVYHFSYNGSKNTLNFGYAGDIDHPDVKALSIVVSNMFNFLVEAQENGDKAIDIIENPDKAKYVDPSAIEDGVSYITITDTLEPNRTEMSFELLLKDDMATKIVDSYELNAPRAPEEPEEPETPEEPEVPEDLTQPTQPTEPVQQPNTGTYLPLIGVMWLAMFGMVFISCRKTMFKKI